MTVKAEKQNVRTQDLQRQNAVSLWEWAILGLVALLVFVSFNYQDFFETMRHSMRFWDALFDGRPLDFYEYCGAGTGGILCGPDFAQTAMDARYDFTIYLVFAVWNFPLWVIEHFAGGNIQNSVAAMIYAKCMVVGAVAVCGRLTAAIVEEMTGEKHSKAVMFSFLSSSVLLASTLLTGQYDVLSLIFILAGVLCYMKEDYKKFILFFMVANSMKYFGILLMLPLLCVKQKNLLKIVRDLVLSMALLIFWKLVFMLGAAGVTSFSGNDNLIGVLTGYKLLGGVSVFWVAYFGLLVYSYRTSADMPREYHLKQTVYIGFVTFVLLYVLTPAYPYWVVLLVPFAAVMMHTCGRNSRYNMVLMGLFEVCLLIKHYTWYSWCYSRYAYIGMVPYHLFGRGNSYVPNVGEFLTRIFEKVSLFNIPSLLAAGFSAAALVMIVLNVPKDDKASITFVSDRSLQAVRMLVSCAVVLIPLVYYVGCAVGVLPYFE